MTQSATADLRPPWGTTSEGEFTARGTIVAAVMGTCAVFVTLPLGVIGIVLSCKGLDRVRRHDPSARRYLLWSWVLFVPGTLVGVPFLVLKLVSVLATLAD